MLQRQYALSPLDFAPYQVGGDGISMGMNRQFLKFAAFGAPSKLVVRVSVQSFHGVQGRSKALGQGTGDGSNHLLIWMIIVALGEILKKSRVF